MYLKLSHIRKRRKRSKQANTHMNAICFIFTFFRGCIWFRLKYWWRHQREKLDRKLEYGRCPASLYIFVCKCVIPPFLTFSFIFSRFTFLAKTNGSTVMLRFTIPHFLEDFYRKHMVANASPPFHCFIDNFSEKSKKKVFLSGLWLYLSEPLKQIFHFK